MRNPKGRKIKVKMTDPKWHMNEGWVKMAKNIDGVEIDILAISIASVAYIKNNLL